MARCVDIGPLELFCRSNGAMPKMVFVDTAGVRHEVDAPLGLSILEVARRHDIDLEGACEGSLACSTCHVVVDPQWYDLLPDAKEDEEDMLDLAFGLTKTSRLGCQIRMTEELDGLTVRLPGSKG
jgi:ferredoxin, 2Fe-2S